MDIEKLFDDPILKQKALTKMEELSEKYGRYNAIPYKDLETETISVTLDLEKEGLKKALTVKIPIVCFITDKMDIDGSIQAKGPKASPLAWDPVHSER